MIFTNVIYEILKFFKMVLTIPSLDKIVCLFNNIKYLIFWISKSRRQVPALKIITTLFLLFKALNLTCQRCVKSL